MSATTFTITRSTTARSAAERAQQLQKIQFGRVFTDHMALVRYRNGQWQDAVIQPYAPISLDPAASVLHYGQAIFEGLKAYRQPDGGVSLFRPEANSERFNRSAARLAMPALPKELFIGAAEALVATDRDWVPFGDGESLYLRPFMIGVDPFLGVRPSEEYLFMLIASPAGEYFQGGLKPVSVWASQEYVRAAPGGTGEAKCAGNYAASLLAQAEAQQHGCDQVVWLDAIEREIIEEMGGMNLFFVYGEGSKAEIVTPALTGTLLPGITRATLLQLASGLGYAVSERQLRLSDVLRDIASGAISEVFACGTAAVITPVGMIKGKNFQQAIPDDTGCPIALTLRKSLLAIQRGQLPDSHNWLHAVP